MQTVLGPGNVLIVQERERYLAGVLRRQGYESLEGLRCFEAGCSNGHNLHTFMQWGARPSDISAISTDPDVVADLQAYSPQIRIHAGSAEAIPEPDESFDLSIAFTLFSGVADEEASSAIADELFRITRPGGLIIVYDVIRRNPANRSVHPVTVDAIRRWFPKCPLKWRRITLAPPIARGIGRSAPGLYGPLAALPFLRTHAMYVMRRPALPLIRAETANESAPTSEA